MEICKFEQCLYVKTAILCGQNAWECHAELSEVLADHAIPYRTFMLFISVRMINTAKQNQLMHNIIVYLFNLCL
jgi:hypothetical protein